MMERKRKWSGKTKEYEIKEKGKRQRKIKKGKTGKKNSKGTGKRGNKQREKRR